MQTKTQELIEDGEKLLLRTVTEESREIVPEDVAVLEAAKTREIAYLENQIRVLQAQLLELQGEKDAVAILSAQAIALRPAPIKEIEVVEELEAIK